MKPILSYFTMPLLALCAAVTAAFFAGGATLAMTVAVLAILEVSLSFDNAVVNAKILQTWDEKWRSRFLTVGIVVAVFGMRLLFPVAIVSAFAHLPPDKVIDMALHTPQQYAVTLQGVHHLVAAFGGTFLLLVALEFFFDQEKDNHWIAPIEIGLNKIGMVTLAEAVVAVAALIGLMTLVSPGEQMGYLTAGLSGVVLFSITKTLGTLAGGGDVTSKVIKASIGGFIYLETLDASFSFDGVIGAFALTDSLIWIMVGLGVGAMAVRELTLLAVDRGTLAEFPHLENGAFWAILALALMMLVGPIFEMPEVIKGLCGAGFILAAFVTSILANRKALQAAA